MQREDQISQRLLLWFQGYEAPAALLEFVRQHPIGGVTLFRKLNLATPPQVRALTGALQAAARAAGQLPLLICADQEGGQLQAVAGATAFPGNMALGATGDAGLARRVGAALGRELAALGVNVNFAPVVDVQSNPANPVIGVRSFSDDPALVGRLASAMVEGLQASGVAATAKHFPGHGDTDVDTHHRLGVVPHDLTRLQQLELAPFAATIAAGARLVMAAHLAVPALTGRVDVPTTLAPGVLEDLLRGTLGFRGVVISDALNMAGFGTEAVWNDRLVQAAAAGVDLLLLAEPNDPEQAYATLLAAAQAGHLAPANLEAAAERVTALKRWLATQEQPDLAVVGCAAHQALAAEVAARAITLVRDRVGRLPLRLPAEARLVVVTPELADLTPADTSSYERCALGAAIRRYHAHTDELVIAADPSAAEVAALSAELADYDLVIIGTINATTRPGQAALVEALVQQGVPVVAAALRLPYDTMVYPAAPTCLCTYSIALPALTALADTLFGRADAPGRLPVQSSA
ncbi:glycoside hydrolase family 3 protein [Candidatus Chloroploca asiatica]|uniref:beta-N-acetylhexosaminidase n=1 Tax=Candidatus Chloroploca asiatica TaxID=1506545 RepID=A0A2H3L7Y8_9CHLR|nr:glycoside hydrolase family 3 protein [Candidatus Chloroploca asiatica]PDV98407.1 hypothetical protein A9Q02_15645 [Candidatus Chloroploca asiatica]